MKTAELVHHLRAAGDETRLRLLSILDRHELNVGEVVQALGLGQSRVSRHLKVLVEAGLVEYRRDGLRVFYRTRDEGPGRGFLDRLSGLMAECPELAGDLDAATSVVEARARATREFFDEVAPAWDDLSREVLGDFDLGAEIGRLTGEAASVADLGCGTGALLVRLGKPGRRLVGVDSSQRMLDEAGTRLSTAGLSASLRLGDLTHLPCRDQEVETAVLSLVLHHVSDPEAVLAEAARIVPPGGQVVVAEFEEHGQEVMRERFGDHRLGFARDDLADMLVRAGLSCSCSRAVDVNMGLRILVYGCTRPSP